jgi:hypothetical protein
LRIPRALRLKFRVQPAFLRIFFTKCLLRFVVCARRGRPRVFALAAKKTARFAFLGAVCDYNDAFRKSARSAAADSMQIGSYQLKNNWSRLMAGVTDRSFRQLCKQMGAGMAVSRWWRAIHYMGRGEIARRANHDGEVEPIAVQTRARTEDAGGSGQHNVDEGAQIIDINMGCPARRSAT